MYIPIEVTQFILSSILILLILAVIFFSTIPIGKRLMIQFVDWYIRNWYSMDYIHRDMIRDEILKRVNDAVGKTHRERDEQESIKLKAMRDNFKIQEEGYIAEIMRLEKNDEYVHKMRKRVEELYFKVVRRTKELLVITAENWHEGEKIINDVSASIGRLDAIKSNTESLVSEIENAKRDDYVALALKEEEM